MLHYFAVILILWISFVSSNADERDPTKPEIEAVEVLDSSPMFGKSFYRAYFSGSFVVYQSQYFFDSTVKQLKFDSSSNQVVSETEEHIRERRSRFFVFHRDSSYGFTYDPKISEVNNRRKAVASALRVIKGTNSFENILQQKPDSTTWNTEKTRLREVYIARGGKDTPTVRLFFYYSRDLNHLKESLNPVLDSVKKMKLYKTEILVDKFYSKKDKRLWPSLKNSTEMKEMRVENPEEVLSYIDKYKKSTGSED